jgi:polyhydroxybutyrate depolymerase
MTMKNLRLLCFILAAALSLACIGKPREAAAFSGRISIQAGGHARTALVVEHERLKKARRAVVIVLHGGKGFGARIRHNLGLEDSLRSAGPVMVYPDALGGNWNIAAGPAAKHDSLFIKSIIAKLVADGIADKHRVFLVGSSSGGLMALRLACEQSQLFAGVAILIASMPANLTDSCHPMHPMRFLMIAGTADPFIPYQGGKANLADYKFELLSVDKTLAIFARAAHCGTGKAVAIFPHHDPKNPTRAYFERLSGCKVPIEFVRIAGGGHSIPGHWKGGERGQMVGPYNNDFDSAALIWNLFRKARG